MLKNRQRKQKEKTCRIKHVICNNNEIPQIEFNNVLKINLQQPNRVFLKNANIFLHK